MFTKRFFTKEGLLRFCNNLSRNICHVSVNSETLCWNTLYYFLHKKDESAVNELMLLGIRNLYDNPNKFNSHFTSLQETPIEFLGLRDVFFTYFICRLPVMLAGTKLTWARIQSPSRNEIISISEHSIKMYAENFQEIPSDLTSDWKKYYQEGLTWTRWWIPISMRDNFYYDLKSVENFIISSLLAMLEIKYPEFLRLKSSQMRDNYEFQYAQLRLYSSWLRLNQHVFIDKLGEHLTLAYPIYSSKTWDGQDS